MGTSVKMKEYYQFEESNNVSLCDCIINRITGLSDKLIFHIPNGLLSITDDNPAYTSSIDVHIVGCGTESSLFYKVRRWVAFGKCFETMFIVDFDKIERIFCSGYQFKIAEEYFAFKSMFLKGSILDQFGRTTSEELIILLHDIIRVDFTHKTDK